LQGTEIYEIDENAEIRKTLESLRSRGAVMLGFASTPEEASEKSQAVPKIAFVSAPQGYKTVTGRVVRKRQVDIVARIMSMGTLHKAYAVTGAICTAGAAKIEGTVVSEMLGNGDHKESIRLGHPGGLIGVGVIIAKKGKGYDYQEAVLERTARRLMDGYVYVPQKAFAESGR
jgi:2-methylaconitate cis-trans-isomerase PrpF